MVTTKTALSRILFLLYLTAVGFICFVSASSVPSLQETILGISIDKIIHFGMFFPFPILSFLSFDHASGKKWRNILFIIVSAIIGCTIAAGTEVIQDYLPSRAMDINDFYADALAVVLCSLLVFIIDVTRK